MTSAGTASTESALLHLLSIGIAVAVLLPVKSGLERVVDQVFAHRDLES